MSRYDPLRWYLAKTAVDHHEVRLTFRDLEKIVGSLPDSARSHRPWWGNSVRSPQAAAWQSAGFIVDQVNLTAELVVFVRGQAQRRSLVTRGVLPVARRSSDRPTVPVTEPGEPDHSEATVQARLAAYLAGDGWDIRRVADTASREPGVDIIAGKGTRNLVIEVKGFPSRSRPVRT
jgi:hypothetical protein